MQTVKNTKIKTYSKVRELETADTVDLVYDVMDFQRAQTISNGTKISSQKGSRRIIDRNRNAIAHTEVDYSQFKVTKLDAGQTVDNSKKEKQLEDAAISLLADLGISWDDEENESDDIVENESDDIVENETEQTVENTEEEDQQEMPEDFEIPDNIVIYTLPESFAGPIVNGDYSELTDRESEIVDAVLSELPDNCYLILWDSDSEFLTYHDAQSYGWKADNCYRFMMIEE